METPMIAALVGSIVVGICYAKADRRTKWLSRLGAVTIMGLILLALGLLATIKNIGM